MECKSIITYCSSENDLDGHIPRAVSLASQLEAHLTVASFGHLTEIPTFAYGELPPSIIAQNLEQAKAEARALAGRASALLQEAHLQGEAMSMVGYRGTLSEVFAERSRFADLVILPALAEASDKGLAIEVTNEALFGSDTSVLVWPANAATPSGKTAVIAWNGSREALRAVRLSLPFLKKAGAVHVVTVNRDKDDETVSRLSTFLRRHGIAIKQVPVTQSGRVDDAVRHHVRTEGADLLVMGAYGHSRLREMILGGATRYVLHEPPCATLMAH
jgi:nucleotide-binding universal stress UspA family protein